MQYVITAACANFSVQLPSGQLGKQLMFKGQPVPPTATPEEIAHHLSINAIKPLAVPAEQAPEVDPATAVDLPPGATPPADDEGSGGDEEDGTDPAPPPDTPDADADAKWAEAQAKAQALTAAGNKPDGRSGPLVLAAYLVAKGYDRSAVEKAEKKDLLDLVNGLSG